VFFNFTGHVAEGWWERRAFLRSWWRGNARDRRWTPPLYSGLYDALVRRHAPHLERLAGLPVTLEAMPRPESRGTLAGLGLHAPLDDAIVATTLPLVDRRAQPTTTFLAMMTFANDDETLDRLLQLVWERTAEVGSQRLVGPSPLAPAFVHGALMDSFHVPPPLHTPYNAPYAPEMLEQALEPLTTSRLWHLDLAGYAVAPAPPGITIAPVAPERLAGDLLPILRAALSGPSGGPGAPVLPDAVEMEFALRTWGEAGPLLALLATVEGEPAGWLLAQAETGPLLRRLRGGRPLWARALLQVRGRDRLLAAADAGRLLLGGVAAENQGQGVGRALLAALVAHGRTAGWRTLAIGPVYDGTPAAGFLAAHGAQPRQRYTLFVSAG
jgi:GNAT superfamily N-acetyltransferase